MIFTHATVQVPSIEVIQTLSTRRYKTPHGTFPSITTILGLQKKDWLDKWKAAVGSKRAEKIRDQAAVRGKATHLLINDYLKNVELGQLDSGQIEVKCFNKAKPILSNISNIRLLETPIYSPKLRIAGTVDCIANFKGELAVIDFKTARAVRTKDQIKDYFLQACAYGVMYEDLVGEEVNHLVILMSIEYGALSMTFRDTNDKYIGDLIEVLREYRKSVH